MADRLKGKLAFCTASGAGIGRATAMAFAREGARVIASDIDEAAFADLKAAGVAECVKLDARDTKAVEAEAQRLGLRRCAVQCRGLRPPRHGARLLGGGLGLLLRPQRQVDAPHHQGVPAGHAGQGRRLHRQRRLHGQLACAPRPTATSTGPPRRPSSASPRRWRWTSSPRASAATASAPAPSSRPRSTTASRRSAARSAATDKARAHVHRAPAHGPPRHRRGDGRGRRVSGLRRIGFHDRHGHHRRRRVYAVRPRSCHPGLVPDPATSERRAR